VEFDDRAFLDALERKRRQLGLSWRQVARDLDLSASTFSRLSRGSRPDLDTFLTLVGWMGVPADTFVTSRAGISPAESPDNTVDAVRRSLRADQSLDAESAAALEDLFRLAYRRLSGT